MTLRMTFRMTLRKSQADSLALNRLKARALGKSYFIFGSTIPCCDWYFPLRSA